MIRKESMNVKENESRETCKPSPSCGPTGQTKINLFYSILLVFSHRIYVTFCRFYSKL